MKQKFSEGFTAAMQDPGFLKWAIENGHLTSGYDEDGNPTYIPTGGAEDNWQTEVPRQYASTLYPDTTINGMPYTALADQGNLLKDPLGAWTSNGSPSSVASDISQNYGISTPSVVAGPNGSVYIGADTSKAMAAKNNDNGLVGNFLNGPGPVLGIMGGALGAISAAGGFSGLLDSLNSTGLRSFLGGTANAAATAGEGSAATVGGSALAGGEAAGGAAGGAGFANIVSPTMGSVGTSGLLEGGAAATGAINGAFPALGAGAAATGAGLTAANLLEAGGFAQGAGNLAGGAGAAGAAAGMGSILNGMGSGMDLLQNVLSNPLTKALANYFVQNGLAKDLNEAASMAARMGDPLSHPTRQPYQQQLFDVMINGNYQGTPFYQGQKNMLDQSLQANLAKYGVGGTPFLNYSDQNQNLISRDYFNLTNQLGNLGGFGLNANPATYGNLASQGATANATGLAGFGSVMTEPAKSSQSSDDAIAGFIEAMNGTKTFFS